MGSILILTAALLLFYTNSISAQPNNKPRSSSNSEPKKTQTEENDRQTNKDKKPLDFSDTGRPGQQTAGESRGDCDNTNRSLKALIPVSHSGKTVSSHPSFWVYFQDENQHISHAEFILQNEAREDIWRSQSKSNLKTGYNSFSIPETEPPLEVGQWYRWYVKVYCKSQTASIQHIQGWINRVPLTSRLYLELQQKELFSHRIYGDYGIWYDAIDRLLNLSQSQPGNRALERDWQNLTEAKGVELHDLPSIGASYEATK